MSIFDMIIYLAKGTNGREKAIQMMPLKARPRGVGELYNVAFPSFDTFRNRACLKKLEKLEKYLIEPD